MDQRKIIAYFIVAGSFIMILLLFNLFGVRKEKNNKFNSMGWFKK